MPIKRKAAGGSAGSGLEPGSGPALGAGVGAQAGAGARAGLAGFALVLTVLLLQGGRLLWRALAGQLWPVAASANAGLASADSFSAAAATGASSTAVSLAAAPAWAPALAALLIALVAFGLPCLALRRGARPFGVAVSLKKGRLPLVVLLPLFLGLMAAVNSLGNLLRGLASLLFPLPEAAVALPVGFAGRLLYFLSSCVAAALLEEILFRGYIQGLLRAFGPRFAIVGASLLFTLMHAAPFELPVVFALSLLLGYVAEISGSVRPCIALHFANNSFSFFMTLAQESMDGMAALALTFWMMLLFIGLFVWAVWAVRRYRLGPKLRLRRDAPAFGPPARRAGRLLATPAFLCGALAVAANFALQFFSK